MYEAWITCVSLSRQLTAFSLPTPLQEFVLPQRRTVADNISLFLFLLHNKINSESKYLQVHNTWLQIPQGRQIIDYPTSLGIKTSLHKLQFICQRSKSIGARVLPKDNQYSFVRLTSATPPPHPTPHPIPSHHPPSSTPTPTLSSSGLFLPVSSSRVIACSC